VLLVWGACAPDRFEPTPWEHVFYPLNGFEHQGHRWFAYPNHNGLKIFNPETSHAFDWCDAGQNRRFRKADLESRFTVGGIEWDYVSTSQLSAATRYVVQQIRGPLRCPAHALVAANDGYWQGKPRPLVERTIRDYLPQVNLLFRPASHLWVVNPSFATDLFRQARRHDCCRLPDDAASTAPDFRGQASPSPLPEDPATSPLRSPS
jgi:hypothetical protein